MAAREDVYRADNAATSEATMKDNHNAHLNASDTLTAGVRVRVISEFLPDETERNPGKYFWSYHITIENESDRRVRLRSRYWTIIDGNGVIEEVSGSGVVGQYPDLPPGESFDYSSFTYLATEWGTMVGGLHFIDVDDNPIEVIIDQFFLLPESAQTAVPPGELIFPE